MADKMTAEYQAVKDLIESHTQHLSERADRADKRIEDRLGNIENTLKNLQANGCAKGAIQDRRLDLIEATPARVGAAIIGLCTIVSTVVALLVSFFRKGGG